jgi:ASC-1-like (ASCH) protein
MVSKKLKKKTLRKTKKMEATYSKHLSEPWFSLINLGLKTVEGRLNKGDFSQMKIGETIEWKNDDFKERSFISKIVAKREYKSFKDYLETEGLNKCLPGIPSLEHGLSVYYKYFTKEDEEKYGIVAISIEV